MYSSASAPGVGREAEAVADEHDVVPRQRLDLREREPGLRQSVAAGRLGVGLLDFQVLEGGVDLLVEDGLELALDLEALVGAERDLRP